MPRTLNLETGLEDDNCAKITRELQNTSINNYSLENFYFTKDCECDLDNNFLYDNNLSYKDGYGFTSGCTVDNDSDVRILNGNLLTHDKNRIQLSTREFPGPPNINKGGLVPNIDSRLKNADDTSFIKNCFKISEYDFNRNIPLVGCLANTVQNSDFIIPKFVWGGIDTRNEVRSNEYLTKCGFEKNEKTNSWVRKS